MRLAFRGRFEKLEPVAEEELARWDKQEWYLQQPDCSQQKTANEGLLANVWTFPN